MQSKNKYIPQYVKKNLKWFERDGLITYINRLEYERFEVNRDSYLKNTNIINFDLINNKYRGDPLENSVRYYKTVSSKDLKQMPLSDKDAALAACFRSERKDICIDKKLGDEYFRTWYDSINNSNKSGNSSSKNKFYKDKEELRKKNQKYFDTW